MTQDKIKKGNLLKTKCGIWGNFFDPNYGHVNIKIKENTLFVVVSDEETINGRPIIQGFIDNKIVSIGVREHDQLRVIN